MNKLGLALKGYEPLAELLRVALNEASSDRAENWLRDEVCPIAEELIRSRKFQLAARWAVDHLEPGVRTEERQLVDGVDSAIVRLAEELVASVVPDDSLDASPSVAEARVGVPVDRYQTLRWVASRPWFDLVSPEEFFHAFRGLHLRTSHPEQTQRFDKSRELRVPLGDYVTRSMLARIDYWTAVLNDIWNTVFMTETLSLSTRQRLFAAKTALEQSIDRLRAACFTGNDAQLREAATTLTQVYVAYAPVPRIVWLGYPGGTGKAEGALIRSIIRRTGQIRIVERDANGLLQPRETKQAHLCDPIVLRRSPRLCMMLPCFTKRQRIQMISLTGPSTEVGCSWWIAHRARCIGRVSRLARRSGIPRRTNGIFCGFWPGT